MLSFFFPFVGDLSSSIMYSALKVAVLASRFVYTSKSSVIVDFKTNDGWKVSFQRLLVDVPKEVSYMSKEMPVRWVVLNSIKQSVLYHLRLSLYVTIHFHSSCHV